jgi:hypothetical protein
MPEFDLGPAHVGFLVNKVVFRQDFIQHFGVFLWRNSPTRA